MRKAADVLVTSKTTFFDSIELRKQLRGYDGGQDASFVPGIGAFPTTRPSFSPVIKGTTVIPDLFPYYCNIIARIYYPEEVPISTSSYGIRKEAKIGLPYNSREEEAHIDLIQSLMRGGLSFDEAGHYIYGSRIQTDSNKIRNTGYVQLKAIGDGFSVQRHRMINAGPAINHLLGIYEFNYHHHLLEEYSKTFNVVVDDFLDSGYAYAWDFKNFERSLGWDILFKTLIERLHEIGRHKHAQLFELMNLQCHIHYRPSFMNQKAFDEYLKCSNPHHYMQYVEQLYGTHFEADDMVRETAKAILDNAKEMQQLCDEELTSPKSPLSGFRIFTQSKVYNNSGVATTATVGKLYAIVDFLCRLSAISGKKYDEEYICKFLHHETSLRLYNLGDDNMLVSDFPIDYDKFLSTESATVITEEKPVAFLSRILIPETSPRYYKNAWLMPQAKSFFRKLSRERDVRSYTVPSEGWTQSYLYAKRNKGFVMKETEILHLFDKYYMSLTEIIEDAKNFLDKEVSGIPISAIEFVDDPGKLYAKNVKNPADEYPFLFFALDPYQREVIIKNYGI